MPAESLIAGEFDGDEHDQYAPSPSARRLRPTGEVVLGVDTHRDAHAGCALLGGGVIGIEVLPATAAGCPELLDWAKGLGAPRAGVEETGPFGVAPVPACVGLANDNKNREDGENRCCRPLASPCACSGHSESNGSPNRFRTWKTAWLQRRDPVERRAIDEVSVNSVNDWPDGGG